jgi:hypothetical protein
LNLNFDEALSNSAFKFNLWQYSKGSRLDQIISWFGGGDADGCILLDECHKAKNFNAGNDTVGRRRLACVEISHVTTRVCLFSA